MNSKLFLTGRILLWSGSGRLFALAAAGAVLTFSSSSLAQGYAQSNQLFSEGKYELSRQALESEANPKSSESLYLLAVHYIQGFGGPKNATAGIELMKQAAQAGSPLAQYYLAESHFRRDRNYVGAELAEIYLRRAATSGVPDAIRLQAELNPEPTEQAEGAEYPVAPTFGPLPVAPVDERQELTEMPAQCEVKEGCETAALSAAGDDSTERSSEARLPEPAAGSDENVGWLAAGGGVVFLGLLFFAGTRCPSCKRIRTSSVLNREQTGQYITTRMQRVRRSIQRNDGTSRWVEAVEQDVPVTVTIREFDEFRKCRRCGHEFIKSVKREAR